jgi:hypothetical protein
MPGLEGLTRALREVPDGATSEAAWRALVGEAFPLIAGCLSRTSELSQGWPCGDRSGGWGCSRTLVVHDRHDIEAVCEERNCPTIKVARGDAVRQRLDVAQLADRLGPALHLHERGTAKLTGVAGASVVVGTLRLKWSFAVAITTVYGLSDLVAVGDAARRAASADRALVLAPIAEPVVAEVHAMLSTAQVEVMPLHDAVHVVDGAPRARLLDFVRRHYTSSVDPSPWFDGAWDLVLDPVQGRAWSREVALDFGGRRTIGRLLYALAQRPNAWVPRGELAEVVYGPDVDPTPLPKRKSELQALLNAAAAGIEIETLGASDDEDGAYRLPIPAGRISFWTELPPPPEGGDDDERKRSGTRKGKSKAAKRKPATRGA